jgi:hypothetical protein
MKLVLEIRQTQRGLTLTATPDDDRAKTPHERFAARVIDLCLEKAFNFILACCDQGKTGFHIESYGNKELHEELMKRFLAGEK